MPRNYSISMDSSFVKIFPKSLRLPIALGAIAASAILGAGNAKAVLVYELIEQGSDVQVKLSGSLSGLPSVSGNPVTISYSPGLNSLLGAITLTSNITGYYYTASGPSSFGNSLTTSAITALSASTETHFQSTAQQLLLSSSYVEGTPITASGLITGKSLATIGLNSTSGLLGTWTIGSDSIEVWAGAKPGASSAASVPGPLPLLGAGAAFGYSRRLRSRLRAGRPSLKA